MRPPSAPEELQPLVAERADDDDNVWTAKGLADVHLLATREQVRAANRMMRATEQLLDRIHTILSSEDPNEISGTTQRLIVGKSDSLGGMMDAATKLMNTAVSIKRRALGMDNVKGPATTSPETVLPEKVRMVLHRMGDDAVMSLRFAATEVARVRDEEVAGHGRDGDDGEA